MAAVLAITALGALTVAGVYVRSTRRGGGPLTLTLAQTDPRCSHPGEPASYCTGDDVDERATKAGVEAKILAAVASAKDPSSTIVLAYYRFSNNVVGDALCARGKAGVTIRAYLNVPNDVAQTKQVARLVAECQRSGDRPNVSVHYLGREGAGGQRDGHSMHMKFLLVDPGPSSPTIRILASSGNLSNYGVSINFDHWLEAVAGRGTIFAQSHVCLVEALDAAYRGRRAVATDLSQAAPTRKALGGLPSGDDPGVFAAHMDGCLARALPGVRSGTALAEETLDAEGVVSLFTPDPTLQARHVLFRAIRSARPGGRIDVVAQHFVDAEIAKAFLQAAANGVTVRVLLDDDVAQGPRDVAPARALYEEHLSGARPGLQVRFVRTWPGGGERPQTLHQKFIVFQPPHDASGARVFTGAGQLSWSGFHINYENYYLLAHPEIVATLRERFEALWGASLGAEDLATPDAGPPSDSAGGVWTDDVEL